MDLTNMKDFAPQMSAKELADYLCRSEEEVIAKAKELGLEFDQ